VKGEQRSIYQAALGEVYRRRFQLVTQFRRAVETGRIILHYQPKLNLAERELAGAEALVRWVHPEYGLVSPTEFVEAIEATGSIDILFSHVLNTALTQAADWLSRGMRIGVAVNLSARNLLAEDFTESVAAALQRHGVPPYLLTLEITESSVMAQPEYSLPVLRNLHAQGIKLAVDDFGTGYSSLAYLRRLPIDEIKIDRSFVTNMQASAGDAMIVRATVDLGRNLGLRVVAEGVETAGVWDQLRALGCDVAQGYFLSRPMPTAEATRWLAARTDRSTPPVEEPVEPAPVPAEPGRPNLRAI
jgi:EAL domain-containing protein (putative c-di-GMP-specific phosphodiesterase class I)